MENTKDDIENSDTSDRCPECSQKTNNILYNYSIWKDGPFNTTDSVNLWNIDNPDGIGIATK
ncbi:6629_t:CDS:2 [Rhizophagus irregularis]|nr:6629_t:CDS:2 [Rhizophagus irregularis]